MKTSLNFVRKHIQEMPAYEPILPFDVLSEELGIPVSELVKLDANENPFGVLPEVKSALQSLETIHIYPDPESRQIRRKLAGYHQISENQIVMGAGADELIDLVVRLVIEPGEGIINCPPTFGMYSFDAVLNQADVISVPRREDFSIDIPAMERAVADQSPKLIFLANPNNPDGSMISHREFFRLVDLPVIFVLDEAYVNFSDGEQDYYLKEVEKRENLIVLRTFSKWAGLAGLRIGYGVFPEWLVPVLMKAKQPYNVSVAAEKAAMVALNNVEQLNLYAEEIVEQRNRLLAGLRDIPWLDPYPSQANFILCKVNAFDAGEVKQWLRQKGILIRYFNKPGLKDHIRISVGTENQIDRLLEVLKGIG